jgi:hypothetical protein
MDRDQNIGQKRTPLRTRSFLSLMVFLKEFDLKAIMFRKKLLLCLEIYSLDVYWLCLHK